MHASISRAPGPDAEAGPRRPVVWHVTEAMGGGIATSIHQFVRATPGFSHHLLCALRPQHQTGELGMFDSVRCRGRSGPLGLLLNLWGARRLPRPDVIHVHSTWAGVVARLVLVRQCSRLVYSPHAYYFERTDISGLRRRIARGIERALAPLTRAVVAVSPHEASLAEQLGMRAHFVPNMVDLGTGGRRAHTRPRKDKLPRLVTVGRVEAQKDPAFFAATVDALAAAGIQVDAVWVGGGDEPLEARLTASGVTVTGWVDRTRVLAELREADVYVHTAGWEGNPLTVLEAEALGLPLAVRSIAPMVSLGHPAGNQSPEALAMTIVDRLRDRHPSGPRLPDRPAERLAEVYGEVSGHLRPAVSGTSGDRA